MSDNLPVERKTPASMIMTKIGGRLYPMRTEPLCLTCQHPERLYIESQLLRARSYRAIVRSLPILEGVNNPSPDGISKHFRSGHMPLPQAVQRRLIEDRAKEIGIGMDDAVDSIADHVTVARMIVHKGGESIMAGDMEPDVKETIAAIKLLHDMERTGEGNIDQDTWVTVMTVYMEIAHSIMEELQWTEFGRRVQANPVLKAIFAKSESQPAIEDAEIIEDANV